VTVEPDDTICARYCRTILALRILEAIARIGALALLTLSGAAGRLLQWTAAAGQPLPGLFLYLVLGAAIVRAATLPWAFWNDYLVERRYGMASQPAGGWLGEWICRSALADIVAAATLLPLALALPWWHLAFVPWFFLALGVKAAYDRWFTPWFLACFYPIRLLRCESFHLPGIGKRVLPVYEVMVSHKTRRVDAYLRIAGRDTAIFVTDTLINAFSDGEEKVVMAHEFGHLYDHLFLEQRTDIGIRQAIRKTLWTLLQIVSLAACFIFLRAIAPHANLRGVEDPAGLPLLVALMLAMAHLIAPILHAESRVDEAEADDFALKITHDPASYRSVMEKLRRLNLEEACGGPALQLLFGTHPTYRQRLGWADACPPRRPGRQRRRRP
jgi:STE24 endopeptidase